MNPVRNKKSEIFADMPKASRISNGMNPVRDIANVNIKMAVAKSLNRGESINIIWYGCNQVATCL